MKLQLTLSAEQKAKLKFPPSKEGKIVNASPEKPKPFQPLQGPKHFIELKSSGLPAPQTHRVLAADVKVSSEPATQRYFGPSERDRMFHTLDKTRRQANFQLYRANFLQNILGAIYAELS